MKKNILIFIFLLICSLAIGQTLRIDPAGDGGFETSAASMALNNWTLAQSAATDRWWVGTAPGGYTGARCAFTGTDAATWSQAHTSTIINHFFQNFTFNTEVLIDISFKYKITNVDGSGSDNLKVSLVGTGTTPTASNPAGGTLIGGPYTSETTWTTVNITGINASSFGTAARLVFSWAATAADPDAQVAIDDISVTSYPCSAPTTQASNINFGIYSCPGERAISWTNGDGTKRIVKCNAVNVFTDPVDGTDPASAGTVWLNTGEQVVYNGTGNNVTVTGLTWGNNYYFRVYEANCSGTAIKFLTSTATNNPNTNTVLQYTLNGTYTIGASGCDYSTIDLAIHDLNCRGTSGPVTFLLKDATYSEPNPVEITYSGTAAKPIVIKPYTGVSPVISFTSATDSTKGFMLNGVDYCTIDGSNNGSLSRDMTVQLTGASGQVIYFKGGATFNTVQNCNLKAYSGVVKNVGVWARGACNNNTIYNNKIYNASHGVYIYGSATAAVVSNTITYNTIGDATSEITQYGINCGYATSLVISYNEIFNIKTAVASTSAPAGISVSMYGDGCTIEKNKVYDIISRGTMPGNGIYLGLYSSTAVANTVSITNNMIWHVTAGNNSISTWAAGIYITRSAPDKTSGTVTIQHNSIYMTPDANYGLNNGNLKGTCILMQAGITACVVFRNNIFKL